MSQQAMEVDGESWASDGSETDSHCSATSAELENQFENDAAFRDAHYDRVAEAFKGQWSGEDEEALRRSGWRKTSDQAISEWRVFVPDWTHPQWDPSVEMTMDGKRTRAARGDTQARMRAAILPRDEGRARTEYTLRWGINPSLPENSRGEARSGLTPTIRPPPDAAASQDGHLEWTDDESFQAFWFDGFTTQLLDTATWAPHLKVEEADLRGNVHGLLNQQRWTQDPGHAGREVYFVTYDIHYSLDGRHGVYDANDNDQVWTALQPSIRLATKILRSRPPYWTMLLNGIYHMRRVPREKDARSEEKKSESQYREFRSLWLDIDEDKMYTEARGLREAGFDAGLATLHILLRDLKWSIHTSAEDAHGRTFMDILGKRKHPRCSINANLVWPLLTSQYSESEKAGYRIIIAQVMLHELAHACSFVHDWMMSNPERAFKSTESLQFSEDIRQRLRRLGEEVLGPGVNRGSNYFFEDEVQLEEGKAMDNQIWGCTLTRLRGNEPSAFRPVVVAADWPWSHPHVYRQSQRRVNEGTGAYNTFLLSPPAPVFDLRTPVPVPNYAPFFQSSWWESEFRRYGHAALRTMRSSAPDALPGSTKSPHLLSTLSSQYKDFGALLMPAIRSGPAYRFLAKTAKFSLLAQKQEILAYWLITTTNEAAASKILRLRLHYERRTWPVRHERIQTLCQKALADFDLVQGSLDSIMTAPFLGATIENILSDTLLDPMNRVLQQGLAELHRLVGYEVQYCQCVISEYFLRPAEQRGMFRRSLRALRTHLQNIHNTVVTSLQGLRDQEISASPPGVDDFLKHEEDRLRAKIQAEAPDWAAEHMNNQASGFVEAGRACEEMKTRIRCHLGRIAEVLALLRDDAALRDGPGAALGAAYAVPVARRTMGMARSLRRAAVRQMARLDDPALKRLVRLWLGILDANMDLRTDVAGAAAALREENRQEGLVAMAESLHLLEQEAENQAVGMAASVGEDAQQTMADMREEVAAKVNEDSSIADAVMREFTDEEKATLGIYM